MHAFYTLLSISQLAEYSDLRIAFTYSNMVTKFARLYNMLTREKLFHMTYLK